ncbi:MAG TPA: polysaccharide deacetylase family protein [Solirubrobacteraceae bacterium]|nr:polysaccharide deacetylase family protein [Solirubrobacteraceae bacterium]
MAALGLLALVLVATAFLLGGAGRGVHHAAARPPASFFARVRTLAGSGIGSVSAAETTGIDRTLAYTPYVRVAGSQHREVALTFDDGPGPYTPQILSILQRYQIPATFFEVGVLEQYFHASTSRIIGLGDVIGDHTFYHAPMARLSPADQQTELLEGARALEHYGAPFPRLFRPPYGLWNSHTLSLLHAERMLMVLWTIDTNDYRLPGSAAIVRAAVDGAKPGAIILLHDGGGNRSETVAALPKIITKLRARGYRFVTVPRLLIDNPPPHDQNVYSVVGHGG